MILDYRWITCLACGFGHLALDPTTAHGQTYDICGICGGQTPHSMGETGFPAGGDEDVDVAGIPPTDRG